MDKYESKAKLGRVLLSKLNPHINWSLLEAHPLYNEAEAVCRLADGWFERNIVKAWDTAQRSGFDAEDLQPDETRFVLAITYLLERIGESRIANVLESSLALPL